MTEDAKPLIAEASEIAQFADEQGHRGVSRVIRELVAALKVATSTPAIDRDALVGLLGQDENYVHDPDADGWVFSAEMAAIGLLDAGLLRDARDLQAGTLEEFGFWLLGLGHMPELGRANMKFLVEQFIKNRAQIVEEAPND